MLYIVVGKVRDGWGGMKSAYAIFDSKSEALRWILESGRRAEFEVEEI